MAVGVLVCDCGETFGKTLQTDVLTEFARGIDGVKSVKVISCLPGKAERDQITAAIREMRTDRIVVVGASPGAANERFRGAMSSAGKNPHLLAMANVREQCGWVHGEGATEKAKGLIISAVARVKLMNPIPRREVVVTPHVLVIGGGLAGLETSRVLGDLGCDVTIVEREAHLGGRLGEISYLHQEGLHPEHLMRRLIDEVTACASVTVSTSTEVTKVTGQIGHFRVALSDGNKVQTRDFGAIVVASGTQVTSPVSEYGLPSDRFTTLLTLQKMIRTSNRLPKRIALILDMDQEDGSVLTGAALRTAVAIRERSSSEVFLLCRNMRVSEGPLESLYGRAREMGVVVFKMEERPEITLGDYTATFTFPDALSGKNVALACDLAAFGERVGPNTNLEDLGEILGVRSGPGQFLQEDNVWLSPTRSNREGIFLAGTCRGMMGVEATLVDAQAAAMEAYEVLAGGKLLFDADRAEVDADKCVLCLTCVRSCPMKAIEVDPERQVAQVMEEACRACGICAAECPAKAIELRGYTDAQLLAETDSSSLIHAAEFGAS
ncbi:MAG: FAD-dependent oxidoreductase [Candidatus Latescibacterota bacterium]